MKPYGKESAECSVSAQIAADTNEGKKALDVSISALIVADTI